MRFPGRKKYDPFAQAPSLFPWYVHEHEPLLLREGQELTWRYVENEGDRFVGTTCLELGNKLFGLVKIYTYLFPSKDHQSFCVWNRSYSDELAGTELRIDIYEVAELKDFEQREAVKRKLSEDKNCHYIFNCEPRISIEIPLSNSQTNFSHQILTHLSRFDSFIAVTGIIELYPENKEAHNTALVEVGTVDGAVRIHPQDWFNLDTTTDFGYQWITRAVRDKNTGRIVGQGIRIADFRLDNSNRQLMK